MLASILAFASRIRAWFSPRLVDQEFESELESHLDLLTEENLRRGMSHEEAVRAARIRLGGAAQLKEINRELRGLPWFDALLQDLRYAFRTLGKSPGFSAVSILTLALGIGANTAIFSVVYAVLLKPLPYPHAEQLFSVFEQQKKNESTQTGMSYLNLDDLRQQNQVFDSLAGVIVHELTLTGPREPVIVKTAVVTSDFFSVFRQKPLAGRVFLPEDAQPGAPATVVVSEGFWKGPLRGEPGIIGSSINLDKRSYQVIGIMPASFRFPAIQEGQQVWIPLPSDPMFGSWMPRRGGHWLLVVGRLKPGVTADRAQAELDGIAARSAEEYPAENTGWLIRMKPLQQLFVEDVRTALLVLLGAVGLVLLIACANLANLFLARGISRSRELAVRAALGAGRARLVRQLMSESALLGLLGGAAGILLGGWGVRALGSLLPRDLPRFNAIHLDVAVLGFALAISLLAVCGVGLAPALFVSQADLQGSLRDGDARAGQGIAGRRMRSLLAASEVALAMVLLVAAGLLLRSFAKLTAVNPGFDVEHTFKANVSLPRSQYSTPPQWLAFSDELLSRVQAEPGVRSAALAVPTPLADGFINLAFDIVGKPPLSAADSRTANYASVTADYLRVMGIPILAGRFFEPRDVLASPRVAVISQTMANIYFPNEDPIGKQIVFGFPPDAPVPRQIVGVVADVRDRALDSDPGPIMYVPYAQAPFWGGDIIVNSGLDLATAVAALRRDLASIDRDLPLGDVAKMTDVVHASVAQARFRAFLLILFATIAVALAGTGIFGVISYSVSCRTREIGVRVALGAPRSSISGMIFRETLLLAAAGLALGIPGALAASRLLEHLLFGVSASDPLTLGGVAAGLVGVAVVAAYLPVRRAVRVDPLLALRHS
jgi:putative ABC transport system permease protein